MKALHHSVILKVEVTNQATIHPTTSKHFLLCLVTEVCFVVDNLLETLQLDINGLRNF
jgi:hypothetical protein